jgi:proteasome lid subunit RPN8/RPN11
MVERVILSEAQRGQIEREARSAIPRECCGLIEGTIDGDVLRVTQLHATRNIAECEDRFEIDPKEQFALIRRLRGTETGIVGCYHSHPNGRADASAQDHVGGGERGYIWLILALVGGQSALGAFVCEGDRLRRIALGA